MRASVVILIWACVGAAVALEAEKAAAQAVDAGTIFGPEAAVLSHDGKALYIACGRAGAVLVFDLQRASVSGRIQVSAAPSGLALSAQGDVLYVTCAAPDSQAFIINTGSAKVVGSIALGHTATAPVLSPDEKTLYVCERFNNRVAFVDLASRSVARRVGVSREPVAAALTLDGKFLLVANHMHNGRADREYVASSVSVVDTAQGQVVRELKLPNGSGLLRDVRLSPDGKHACVTHQIGRFQLPTTQVERGWINCNALTILDVDQMCVVNTVLLDNIDRGAANPWAAAWTRDGKALCVTHAGTHELSFIDWPALLEKLQKGPGGRSGPGSDKPSALATASDASDDLAYLVGIRRRVALPEKDLGPRALVIAGGEAYVCNHFSDTVSRVPLATSKPGVESMPLAASAPMSQIRRGELLFNNASICFQGWQSCASCHSSDGRVDGLNWDNLNDGVGNPKNVKSLLLAHRTPPSMAMGVREDAEYAVRAGIEHMFFTVRPEEEAAAIDAYLKSLQPIPSPYLLNGALSPAAERGRKLFFDQTVGCADCHRPPLFTNLKRYDVGTSGPFDQPGDTFDTPTLIELWRTAPYLHDGRAVTVQETLSHWNSGDKRGTTSHLNGQEIEDLAAYVLSL